MGVVRDGQRAKLYKWENSNLREHPLNKEIEFEKIYDFCINTLNSNGYHYKRKLPKITKGRKGCKAYFSPSQNVICLPSWARNVTVICHELAHYIVDREYDHSVPSHGSIFIGIFLKLLESHGFNKEELYNSCKDVGLKVKR